MLRRIDWWLVLIAGSIAAVGVLFVNSATTVHGGLSPQAARQAVFLCLAVMLGLGVVLVPYPRIMRMAWGVYALAILALLGLPIFGSILNGARRWYTPFGVGVQPSEFAKVAVIIALAAWLRFRSNARTFEGLVVPILITALPVGLIMQQPDLGSSLVFWPVLLAMCYAAGSSGRSILALVVIGAAGLVVAALTILHDYQLTRIEVWWDHFFWDRSAPQIDPEVIETLRQHGYQPWQSLIAIGSGGLTGFGYAQGPQSQFDFLPYRAGDYIYSVIAEETGLVGALGLLGLQVLLSIAVLAIALRTRERFGRLLAVGVAAMLATQALLHIAVCLWLVPATGLPAPLVSQGGSSTLAATLALALAVNVGARVQPVLAADGFS